MQGLGIAKKIVLAPTPLDQLEKLYDAGAGPYFDVIIVERPRRRRDREVVRRQGPDQKIYAIVTPNRRTLCFDLAQAFADGATLRVAGANPTNVVRPHAAASTTSTRCSPATTPTTPPRRSTCSTRKATRSTMPVLASSAAKICARSSSRAATPPRRRSSRCRRPLQAPAPCRRQGRQDVTDVGKKGGAFPHRHASR